MTLPDIDAELAVCEAATPGPWRVDTIECWDNWYAIDKVKVRGAHITGPLYHPDPECSPMHMDDATFIVHARANYEPLLRAMKRVREIVKRGRSLERATSQLRLLTIVVYEEDESELRRLLGLDGAK